MGPEPDVTEAEAAGRTLGRSIELRPVSSSDLPFLEALYATTRPDIAALEIDEISKGQLLSTQFRAQHEHYQRYFADATFDVILDHGTPVGRLYVHRSDEELRLIDIALLPELRGRGIGGCLIEALLEEAATAAVPVRLRVEPGSPALSLYRRLGFTVIADERVNLHMECAPPHRHLGDGPLGDGRLGDRHLGDRHLGDRHLGDKGLHLGDNDRGLGDKDEGLGEKDPGFGDDDPGFGDDDPGFGDNDPGLGEKGPGRGSTANCFGGGVGGSTR
jgi:GNAT superfamily N-acetyltransferase